MPSLDINSKFAGYRAKTRPMYKVPKNVKEALCIDSVYEGGIFKLEPGNGTCLYDRCYLFEDIGYANLDKGKKRSTLTEFITLFRSMEGQYKFTIASEHRDMDSFLADILHPVNGEAYPIVAKGMGEWVNQKIEEGTRDIRRVMYLTVTCSAGSYEDAVSYFTTLEAVLQNIFRSLKSRIYRLDGEERLASLQRMLRAGGPGIPPKGKQLETDDWKNQIIPASIVQDADYLLIDNKRYVSVLYAHDFGQSLNEETLLYSLTDVPFATTVTVDMNKVPKRIVRDRLMAAHANNEKLISQENDSRIKNRQYGMGTSYTLAKKKADLEEDLDQVDENDEEGVFAGLLVMTYADDLDELTRRVDLLKDKARANNYLLDTYNHMQLKALMTVLPTGGRHVSNMRFFYTSSAAAFFPFHAADLHEEGACYVYGLNQTTGHLLIGDRKNLPAGHGFVTGHTGSGKSYWVKETEITPTLLYTDDNLIILDPNNEQQSFIESLSDGQYFDLTPQSGYYLNPFEVPERIEKGTSGAKNQFVAKMKEYAVSFCFAIMTNTYVTQVHANHIGRAVRDMYDAYFAEKSGRKKKEQYPTLTLFREYLLKGVNEVRYEEDRKMIYDIADSLEEYTTGAYDMFARVSNIDMNSRIVGFGLRNIDHNTVWEPAMLTIMQFLTMRIDENQKSKKALRLIVDEAQVMCEKETTADQLLYAVETYRKVGAIVTLVAQNLTHVLEHPRMRDMFSNCPYKVFLDQGGIDAVNLAQIQELSTAEARVLEEQRVGRGILVWGGRVFIFDSVMDKDNPLYECARKEMKEQNFITGAWFGNIADPARPEQYIAVQFTGYSFEESVRLTARLYSPSDPAGMDVTFQQEVPYENFKADRPTTFMRHVRKMSEQFPDDAKLEFYNPHALADRHTTTEFENLLRERERKLNGARMPGAIVSKVKGAFGNSQKAEKAKAPML